MDAVNEVREGKMKASDFDTELPTVHSTLLTTAILEAGRRSLDSKGASYEIVYDKEGQPTDLQLCKS